MRTSNRTNIYDEGSGNRVGHFDYSAATRWSDADHNGNGSRGTGRGEAVLLTADGKWILESWSNWQGEATTCAYITPDEAREWLLRNYEDEAAEEHFGPIPGEADLR